MRRKERKECKAKRFLAAAISAAMIITMMPALKLSVYADDDQDNQDDQLSEYVNGYIPFEYTYKIGDKTMVKDMDAVGSDSPLRSGTKGAESELPESYRSDTEEWAEGIRVKNQDRTSLCWAFAMTSAAEYSYAKEVYEETGTVWTVQELSPGHLGQFHYNHVNDPLGNTYGDANDVPTGKNWPLYGGNDIFAMQTWASWSGAALEDTYSIDKVNSHIIKDKNYYDVWDGQDIVYPAAGAYDDELILQESIVLFHPVRNTMKELILKYGAISGSMEFDYNSYMNRDEIDPETDKPYPGGRSYYNYNKSFSANHAVTLVGWDDNYPKESFTHVIESEVKDAKEKARKDSGTEPEARKRAKAYAEEFYQDELPDVKEALVDAYVEEHLDEYINQIVDEAGEKAAEESRKKTTPDNNGAWIMQNSWGEDVHDHGFVYVSYEDIDFNTEIADLYAFDMQAADTYTYNFQYDGNSISSDSSDRATDGNHLDYYTKPGSRAANIFENTTENYVKVEAVGYTTFSTGEQVYDVSVYTGLQDKNDPESGEYRGTTRITTTTRGCKTGVLDEPVYVAPGETFSIVFDFTDFSAFGVETAASSPYFFFSADIDPGQSFFSRSKKSKWIDMDGYDACFRIKAFANPTEAPQPITSPFVDVTEDKYYYDAVMWGISQEPPITTGVDDTHYDPSGLSTRGQAVTFLWRMAGCPAPTIENPFEDVAEGKYYYDAVLWAYENGITTGKSDTTFDPSGKCTRKQFITFLWRMAGCPEATIESPFVDVPEDAYYADAVLWAYANEITSGTDKTHFSPNDMIKRGQLITFLYRYSKLHE